MNTSAHPLLLVMYSGITAGTILLMTILVKYLKEKALQKQHIRDQVLSDLAIISGGFVVTRKKVQENKQTEKQRKRQTLDAYESKLSLFLLYFTNNKYKTEFRSLEKWGNNHKIEFQQIETDIFHKIKTNVVDNVESCYKIEKGYFEVFFSNLA